MQNLTEDEIKELGGVTGLQFERRPGERTFIDVETPEGWLRLSVRILKSSRAAVRLEFDGPAEFEVYREEIAPEMEDPTPTQGEHDGDE